jgi:hypothetical protein
VSHEERATERAQAATDGSWARLYALVLVALALDIALLWWLTERYK